MSQVRSRRAAFTLVELLVVISIIGVLIALLLPAIQASREAARRLKCGNNVSQLILAVQSYELTHQSFPIGTVNATGPIEHVAKGYHHNWIIALLPHMEQYTMAQTIDDGAGVYDAKNASVRQLHLVVLQCPSEGISIDSRSNYVGIHHHTAAPIDTWNTGAFVLNRANRVTDFSDGLSQTFFLSEKRYENDPYADLGWMSGTRATLRNLSEINGPLDPPAASRPNPDRNLPGLDMPVESVEPGAEGSSTDEREPIDLVPLSASIGPIPTIDPAVLVRATPVGGLGSFHPGGVNVAFGDGAVAFFRESVDSFVIQQLAHRADGRLPPQWED